MTKLLLDAAVVGARRRRCRNFTPAVRRETKASAIPLTRRP